MYFLYTHYFFEVLPYVSYIPSGKRLHNELNGKTHYFYGHFSIAFCMFTRPGIPIYSHDFPIKPMVKPPFLVDMSYKTHGKTHQAGYLFPFVRSWRGRSSTKFLARLISIRSVTNSATITTPISTFLPSAAWPRWWNIWQCVKTLYPWWTSK